VDLKDRFEACLKLADFWSGRHDARREYEWKVSLGFWGVLLAAIHYGGDTKKVFPSSPCLLLLTLAGVFLFFLLFWLFPLWQGNYKDQKKWLHYSQQSRELLANPNYVVEAADEVKIKAEATFLKFIVDWAMFFQAGTTAALLIVLWRVLNKAACS
jgi:hypothetical protein